MDSRRMIFIGALAGRSKFKVVIERVLSIEESRQVLSASLQLDRSRKRAGALHRRGPRWSYEAIDHISMLLDDKKDDRRLSRSSDARVCRG